MLVVAKLCDSYTYFLSLQKYIHTSIVLYVSLLCLIQNEYIYESDSQSANNITNYIVKIIK